MDANEIMQAFDKQYGSAAILPTIALFAGIAIGVIGIIGLIISLIGKGKTTGIGKISSVLTPIELILGIISLLAFAGVTAIILLGTNGITEPNDLFYGFAYTPAKFGMPISENGPIDTVVIITYAIVFALPALLCLGAAVVGFIGKGKAKNAAANITAQPQFTMNAINGQPTPQPNMAQQPVPQPNMTQQPVPQPDMAGQPVPQPDMVQQPVPQPEMAQQPIPQSNMAGQPVPQPDMAQQPAPKKDMISCPVCGNELEADRTFCTKCGVKLALADEEDDNIPSAPVDNSAQTDADIINESQPTDNVIAAAPFAAEPAPASEPAPEVAPINEVTESTPASEPAPEVAPAVEAVPSDTQNATAPAEEYSSYFDAPEPAPETAPETAPENNIGGHICAVCGNVLNENSAFCTKCGTPVNAQPAPEVAPAVEAVPTDTQSTTAPAEDYSGYFDANEPVPENNIGGHICAVCGNVLNENSAFCTKCGTPVNAQPVPEVTPAVEAVPTDTPIKTAPAEDYSGYFDAPETAPASEPAPENNIGGHICMVCGNVLNANSAFCTKCGTPVNAQPAPEVAPAIEAVPADTQSATAPAEDYSGYFGATMPALENNIGGYICTVCGNVLNENSAFCTKCGTPLNAQPAPVEAVQPVPLPVPTNETAQPAPQSNTRFCVVCGNVLNETSAFCTKCGTPVASANSSIACPCCGAKLTKETKFCVKCGTKIL